MINTDKLLIQMDTSSFSQELRQKVQHAVWYDSSCSETAKTYFLQGIEENKNAYLKIIKSGEAPSMGKDVKVLQWLKGKFPAADVLYYGIENGYEYMLATEVSGEDATHPSFLQHPEAMVRILGQSLRRLHNIEIKDCPIDTDFEKRLEDFRFLVQKSNGAVTIRDDSVSHMSTEEMYKASFDITFNPEDRVFTHGDYCLPNIVIQDDKLSGFIDLGNAGISDRYYDIAWALWSLNYNLKSRDWEKLFFESYGLDHVDYAKIKYYLAMDQA